MVSVLFALRVKSPASAFVPAAAATVTVVTAVTAWSNVAVTVAALPVPLSSMVEGVRTSVACGRSATVTSNVSDAASPSPSVAVQVYSVWANATVGAPLTLWLASFVTPDGRAGDRA